MERFDFCWNTNNGQYPETTMSGMVQDVDGEYVRYDDAAAEIARLSAEVERLSQPCEWSACMRRKPTQVRGE